MTGVRLTWRGMDQIRHRLTALAGRDLSHPMALIAAHLETATRHRFGWGTSPDGKAWKPSKRVLAHGGQTLVKSTILRDSITSRSSDKEAEVGTNVIYGAIHQLGGQAGRKHAVRLPARPYLGLSSRDGQVVEKIIADFLRKSLA